MATPQTPTKSSTKTTTTTGKNISDVRRILRLNHFFIDDLQAVEKAQELENRAFAIINQDRGSEIKSEAVKKAWEIRDKYSTANETTFLVNFWLALVGDTRQIKQDGEGYSPEDIRWIEQAWDKSHLRCNWNQDFIRGSVPALQPKGTDQKLFRKVLCQFPKVKNPRPDLCYGTDEDAYSEHEKLINNNFNSYTMISKDAYHASFAVEVKSAQGSIEDAENQCCRSGAAMVAASRNFNVQQFDKVPARTLGPDVDSFCLTMSLVPTSATIYLHWAEITTTDTHYHMSALKSYHLRTARGKEIKTLRHDLDNVLDWVTLTRKNAVQVVCANIKLRIDAMPSPPRKKAKNFHDATVGAEDEGNGSTVEENEDDELGSEGVNSEDASDG